MGWIMFERGSNYLVKLYPSKGAEPGKTRPVLVLQTNLLYSIDHSMIIILPLTTNLIDEAYPLRLRISKSNNLLKDSEILFDQIRAVDRERLLPDKLASLSYNEMMEVELQIQMLLDFTGSSL